MSQSENEAGQIQPEVSVVIVSYFTGPLLDRAIGSIVEQTNPVELVVVNNGNPQDVTKKLQQLAERDERVTFLAGHGNIGFARGCNLGAKRASARLLFFLNPDAELPPDALRELIEESKKCERPWMLGARLVNADGSEQRGGRREALTPWSAIVEGSHIHRLFPRLAGQSRFNKNDQAPPRETEQVPVISGACMMLPKDDYWSIGGMDEGFFLHVEDVDFCHRFRDAGGAIYFVPRVDVRHDVSSSAANSWSVEWHKTRGFLRYFWKHFRSQYFGLSFVAVSLCVGALFDARSAVIGIRRLTGSSRAHRET